MMMNDTVARIVEIMFQDVKENEEVAGIRDEVMNNCQERYQDLVTSGVGEDDAIAAVIESLKGMEDVLAPYKRKAHTHEVHDADSEAEEYGEQNVTFAADAVHKIDLALVDDDVTIETSDDGQYHITWDKDENPQLQVVLEHGVLKIDRNADLKMPERNKEENARSSANDGFWVEVEADSISGLFKSIGDSLRNAFSKSIHFGFKNSAVTIQIPENANPRVKLLTTSGDIDVQDVALADLEITSTSGDVSIDLNENQHMERIELRTTSGDIEVSAFADRMSISSTSGDVEAEGRMNDLNVSTISGDIDVRADVVNVNFKAISGDVDMAFDSVEIREVRGSTISGDIDIDLPDGIGAIAINTSTRSGDMTTRHHTNGIGPMVNGSVSSMSGDITIR